MVQVIKQDGEKEEFSEEKIKRSIERAGIPAQIQTQVLAHVKAKLYDNIPTSEIYNHITEFLSSASPVAKAKYSLKQAIMALGPTGYPFEDFMAKVLQSHGYKTSVRNILSGTCITHEVDIILEKDTKRIAVEAKFHNMPGTKTNVHVALYTKARFDDVKTRNELDEAWLITNTKITTDAIAYAQCVGMKVIAWNYPQEGNLADLVERSGLSPITSLTSLSDHHKKELAQNNVILSKDICQNPACLRKLGLPDHIAHRVLSEAKYLTDFHSLNFAQA